MQDTHTHTYMCTAPIEPACTPRANHKKSSHMRGKRSATRTSHICEHSRRHAIKPTRAENKKKITCGGRHRHGGLDQERDAIRHRRGRALQRAAGWIDEGVAQVAEAALARAAHTHTGLRVVSGATVRRRGTRSAQRRNNAEREQDEKASHRLHHKRE
jgi:hypothetical protein